MQLAVGDEVIGREDELSALAAAVAGLGGGRGGAVWIEGPAGAGKSTLINAAVGRAAPLGCTVLRAAGDELTAPFPLRMMADCLEVSRRSPDPARAALASVSRGGTAGTAGTAGLTDGAARGMAEMVQKMCGQGPVLLAGDDLHWADEASLTLWLRLVEMTAELPLLLLAAARRVPARAGIAAGARCGPAARRPDRGPRAARSPRRGPAGRAACRR